MISAPILPERDFPRGDVSGAPRDPGSDRVKNEVTAGTAQVVCRFEGRVEYWEPPETADVKSSHRWRDQRKVGRVALWTAEPIETSR